MAPLTPKSARVVAAVKLQRHTGRLRAGRFLAEGPNLVEAAAARAMEAARAEDDAYLLGCHGGTGTRVAIGEQKHAIARVRNWTWPR